MPPKARATLRATVCTLALCTLACGPKAGEVDDAATDTEASTTGPTTTTAPSTLTGTAGADDSTGTDPTTPGVPNSNAIDILLVMDNSGSMGEEQGTLAANIQSLVEVLDAAGADWRLGVTTTDNGNPWCDGTQPEGGKLVATSCRSRTQDFVFQGAMMTDATQEACLDHCPEEWANIALGNGVPWIESAGGTTNLPAGLSPVQAMQCMLPQGINGCGFEQPLESLHKAIQRSATEGEASFGFLRPDASLGILIVTDEADCSNNTDHETIFLPDGNRVFWANPDEGAPTSAVCWNAGVACTGSGTYDECHSVDLDVNGNAVGPDDDDDDAALRPVARYIEQLQSLEDSKREINPGAEVLVMLIAGVGEEGSVTYADTQADPGFQTDFGIGPGCQSAAGRAVPPVRLRELGDALAIDGGQHRFSICSDNYDDALSAFGKRLVTLLP